MTLSIRPNPVNAIFQLIVEGGISTKSQASNYKWFPIRQIPNLKQNHLGLLDLEIEIYLGFGI